MSRFQSDINAPTLKFDAVNDQRFSSNYATYNQVNSNLNISMMQPPPPHDGRCGSSTNFNDNNNSFPRTPVNAFNQRGHIIPHNSTTPNIPTYAGLPPPPPPFFNVPPPPTFDNNSRFRPTLQSQSSSSKQYNFYSSQAPGANIQPSVSPSAAVAPHNQPYTPQNSIANYSSFHAMGQVSTQYPSTAMMSDQSRNQSLMTGGSIKNDNKVSQTIAAIPQAQHSNFPNQTLDMLQTASNSRNVGGNPIGNSLPSNFYQTQPLMNFPPPPLPMTQLQTQPTSNMQPEKANLLPMPLTNMQPPFSLTSGSSIPVIQLPLISEESRLHRLLQKYVDKEKVKHESKITVAEFRASLADAFDILNQLSRCKEELESCINTNEKTWKAKVIRVVALQDQLCKICDNLSDAEQIQFLMMKLQRIKKKRERKRQQKLNQALAKKQEEQNRAEKHREVDRWFDALKEKNEQAKREGEMKKEADSILSEVRRKIYEAKRTVEKLKIFEKLRQARRENAVKKGMFILPKHDRNFEIKISNMKDVIQKQLVDYEAEERALKVMLETEQEGQREEEASWRMKKLEEIQNKKHKKILSCLFGNTDPPVNSPLYYFWQNYNIANTSIENLVKIRHMWDVYLVSPDSLEGGSIPQQWVVPELPSDDVWASVLEKNS